MINLNLISLIYLFFRLAPIIIVCTFTLQVILNSDVRSFMFLLGLCILLLILGAPNIIEMFNINNTIYSKFVNFDILQSNNDNMVPISIPIYGFIISFIMYIIGTHKIWAQNIPILTIFPFMALSDFIWNVFQNKTYIMKSLGVLFISACIGCGWAFLSNKYIADFNRWSGIRNNMCKNLPKTYYKCTSLNKKKT
jgi:hypothetical protein